MCFKSIDCPRYANLIQWTFTLVREMRVCMFVRNNITFIRVDIICFLFAMQIALQL